MTNLGIILTAIMILNNYGDYALKTPFYYSLLEQLQQNLMSDNTLETIVDDLIKENGELKSKVSSLISINEKLMTMVK